MSQHNVRTVRPVPAVEQGGRCRPVPIGARSWVAVGREPCDTAVVAALTSHDSGPCERCGAESWRVERPGPVAGTTRWLRSGGPWRPSRLVCRGCGAPGPSAGWLVRWGDDDRSRLTLPTRVLRDLLRTIAAERTAQPAPWLYLASSAGGAAVGAGTAVMSRSGRPLLTSAAGASLGGFTCWSVFAVTALRQPSTYFELRAAALQQVAPRRAAGLRAARHDAVARSGSFFAYGLVHWDGPRVLAGHSSEGSPPRLTSVALGHGGLSPRAGPWVIVDTAERDRADQHGDEALADALWDDASTAHDVDPSELDEAALLAHLRAVRTARAARPEGQWHDGALLVNGQHVSVRWAGDGEHWVAHVLLGDLSVALRAYGVPLGDISLVKFHDLDAYASWSA